MFHDTLTVVLLVFGFGFVIFFHELGHFLAAKAVGIKVEQFAVGFGQAIIAWRRGVGFRVGSTTPDYQRKVVNQVASTATRPADQSGQVTYATPPQPSDSANALSEQAVADAFAALDPVSINQAERALRLDETEYRLNWIPLGGYVKMLGQDDLRPNANAQDPRAYNQKSIGARMLVVSAGVIMNIILAAIGFMMVFRIGFKVPPAVVGAVAPDSPAQRAGLHVGDGILYLDGKRQYDWTKIGLNVALLSEGEQVPIVVERDGKTLTLQISAARPKGEANEFLSLGIEPYHDLRGMSDATLNDQADLNKIYPEALAVKPGEQVIAINGEPVRASDSTHMGDYWKLDQAVQQSFGKPIALTIKADDGSIHTSTIRGHFAEPFGAGLFNLLGMVPRTRVDSVIDKSPAVGKLLPGDIIVGLTRANNDRTSREPTREQLTQVLHEAGSRYETVSMSVLRRGEKGDVPVEVGDLHTGLKLEGTTNRGLGIGLGYDEEHSVAADVIKDSPAARAGVPAGARITSINGTPVTSWYAVDRELQAVKPDTKLKIGYTSPAGQAVVASVPVNAAIADGIHTIRFVPPMLLLQEPENAIRKTDNLLVAASWGITETRDFVLQFYLTLRRMIEGKISPSNMMGPLGIFLAGKKLAFKGFDWLIWFLSMISANLAVVNFLPIPIVDGGLFTFLLLEKMQGRPVSPRVQAIAQYVGLAFLVGVFLFVTYHDVARNWM